MGCSLIVIVDKIYSWWREHTPERRFMRKSHQISWQQIQNNKICPFWQVWKFSKATCTTSLHWRMFLWCKFELFQNNILDIPYQEITWEIVCFATYRCQLDTATRTIITLSFVLLFRRLMQCFSPLTILRNSKYARHVWYWFKTGETLLKNCMRWIFFIELRYVSELFTVSFPCSSTLIRDSLV